MEDLAALGPTSAPTTHPILNSVVTPSTAEPRPVPPPHAPSEPAPPPLVTIEVEVPRSVSAFDETVIEGKLKPFVELTKSFAAPSVIEQVSVYLQRRVTQTTVIDPNFIDRRFLLWNRSTMIYVL